MADLDTSDAEEQAKLDLALAVAQRDYAALEQGLKRDAALESRAALHARAAAAAGPDPAPEAVLAELKANSISNDRLRRALGLPVLQFNQAQAARRRKLVDFERLALLALWEALPHGATPAQLALHTLAMERAKPPGSRGAAFAERVYREYVCHARLGCILAEPSAEERGRAQWKLQRRLRTVFTVGSGALPQLVQRKQTVLCWKLSPRCVRTERVQLVAGWKQWIYPTFTTMHADRYVVMGGPWHTSLLTSDGRLLRGVGFDADHNTAQWLQVETHGRAPSAPSAERLVLCLDGSDAQNLRRDLVTTARALQAAGPSLLERGLVDMIGAFTGWKMPALDDYDLQEWLEQRLVFHDRAQVYTVAPGAPLPPDAPVPFAHLWALFKQQLVDADSEEQIVYHCLQQTPRHLAATQAAGNTLWADLVALERAGRPWSRVTEVGDGEDEAAQAESSGKRKDGRADDDGEDKEEEAGGDGAEAWEGDDMDEEAAAFYAAAAEASDDWVSGMRQENDGVGDEFKLGDGSAAAAAAAGPAAPRPPAARKRHAARVPPVDHEAAVAASEAAEDRRWWVAHQTRLVAAGRDVHAGLDLHGDPLGEDSEYEDLGEDMLDDTPGGGSALLELRPARRRPESGRAAFRERRAANLAQAPFTLPRVWRRYLEHKLGVRHVDGVEDERFV